MTSSLGFGYIWIDSLCIIQDSQIDWAEQSSLMAFVYGNADLVLAASNASSAEDGFIKERKGYRVSSLKPRCIRDKKRTLALRYRLQQPKDMPPMLDPLDSRGWALQERLLARRYLAFGSHDTSWTCMMSLTCECEWWRVRSITRRDGIQNNNRVIRDATEEELRYCWRDKSAASLRSSQHYFPFRRFGRTLRNSLNLPRQTANKLFCRHLARRPDSWSAMELWYLAVQLWFGSLCSKLELGVSCKVAT